MFRNRRVGYPWNNASASRFRKDRITCSGYYGGRDTSSVIQGPSPPDAGCRGVAYLRVSRTRLPDRECPALPSGTPCPSSSRNRRGRGGACSGRQGRLRCTRRRGRRRCSSPPRRPPRRQSLCRRDTGRMARDERLIRITLESSCVVGRRISARTRPATEMRKLRATLTPRREVHRPDDSCRLVRGSGRPRRTRFRALDEGCAPERVGKIGA